MPIVPVNYVDRPYVRSPRFAELLLRQGEKQADSIRRGGEISGQMWANLGNQIGAGIQSYAKERQEAPIRAQEAEAARLKLDRERMLAKQDERLMQLFSGEQMPDPRAIVSVVGPERGLRIAQGLAALQADPKGDFDASQKILRDTILGMDALSEPMRAQLFPGVRQSLVQRGVIKPEDAPEQYDADWWTRTRQYGQAPKAPTALMQRDPTRDLVNPETGAVVTPGVPAPERPTNPTEASLAAAAAAGDKNAVEALRLLRAQQPPRQGQQPQYVWATDPKSGDVIRMTEDEARQIRATQPAASGRGAPVQLRNERIATALNSIERLKALAPERVPGLFGIVQGAIETLKGYAGYNTNARQYQALVKPTAMQMAAAVQGAANLSDTERKAMAETLGSIWSMDYESQMALLKSAADLLSEGADLVRVGDTWVPRGRAITVKDNKSSNDAGSALEELERRRKAQGR